MLLQLLLLFTHVCPVTGIFQKAAKESGVVKPGYGG